MIQTSERVLIMMKRTTWAAALLLLLAGNVSAFAAGAIAVDMEQGQKSGDEGYGIGWGQSREEAAKNAIKQCRDAGNDGCQVVARFDSCGAFASNRSTYGVGWGATESAAKAMALDNCDNCRIAVSECE
jgi:hypothetical protein